VPKRQCSGSSLHPSMCLPSPEIIRLPCGFFAVAFETTAPPPPCWPFQAWRSGAYQLGALLVVHVRIPRRWRLLAAPRRPLCRASWPLAHVCAVMGSEEWSRSANASACRWWSRVSEAGATCWRRVVVLRAAAGAGREQGGRNGLYPRQPAAGKRCGPGPDRAVFEPVDQEWRWPWRVPCQRSAPAAALRTPPDADFHAASSPESQDSLSWQAPLSGIQRPRLLPGPGPPTDCPPRGGLARRSGPLGAPMVSCGRGLRALLALFGQRDGSRWQPGCPGEEDHARSSAAHANSDPARTGSAGPWVAAAASASG